MKPGGLASLTSQRSRVTPETPCPPHRLRHQGARENAGDTYNVKGSGVKTADTQTSSHPLKVAVDTATLCVECEQSVYRVCVGWEGLFPPAYRLAIWQGTSWIGP